MCVAVATDGGLITPIVPKAETKVSNIIRVYIPSGFARKLYHKKTSTSTHWNASEEQILGLVYLWEKALVSALEWLQDECMTQSKTIIAK